jgi:hypothetical protein
MADIQISNLPTYTGNTTASYLVMNDSGNTTTYKVLKENIAGDGLTYDNTTRITGDMVWDAIAGGSGGGEKVAGGLMYNYITGGLPSLTSGNTYGNTIIIQPGETLTTIEFPVQNYATTGTLNIGLYSIKKQSTLTSAKAYVPGNLLHTITTGYTVSSNGDKVITSINYTAKQGDTANNVYFVAFTVQTAGFNLARLSTNNLIAHVNGGSNVGGIFYRSYLLSISATGGTLVKDLSTYSIVSDTGPGMYFTYKTL